MLTFLFEQIPDEFPDFCATLEEILPLGDEGALSVAHYVGHGAASGAPVEMTTGGLYRFDGGVIAWFKEFPSRAEALEAAGSPE